MADLPDTGIRPAQELDGAIRPSVAEIRGRAEALSDHPEEALSYLIRITLDRIKEHPRLGMRELSEFAQELEDLHDEYFDLAALAIYSERGQAYV